MNNINTEPEFYPIEALHWAAMKDENLNELKAILKKYPEYINATNIKNDNLLIVATRVGNFEIIKYLIEEENIDTNHSTTEGNALLIAIQNRKMDIAKYLIERNIDIHSIDNRGQNSLFIASQTGNDQLIETLINKNVNVNHLDNHNQNI